ncbi:purine-nucleoside phosphorylase [Peptostreptococcus porci]|uniref:purine-nucleoside phosphorylase n=1 Tax=Peptostreptococcus porci TaxID=2652282 RepID=UPI002A758C7F|nr:purine-nucleoside phosphorylase [Peptostreptococcus porci]MDY2795122.1 purine-nucleoside phosphorylase [Peptostreptococcus porci]
MENKIQKSAEFILNATEYRPEIALILGSGLGSLADCIEDKVVIPYSSIPNFMVSEVEGHKNQLVIGKLNGRYVLAMQGRFHYYEGYTQQEITYPIRVFKKIGIKKLIVTNAAGGCNLSMNPGDLMIINDHINFSGSNPLIGKNLDDFGVRFPDMSNAYNKKMIEVAKKCAADLKINVKEGVYMYFSGPSYETPSEVKMARLLGVDAVGMSTVPEVIISNHSGIDVLGISCITNMAAGILDQPLNHEEVVETSNRVKNDFSSLIKAVVEKI